MYRVLVLLETSREYGRGLLRGIYRYNSLHRQWQIEQQAPFYLVSGGVRSGEGVRGTFPSSHKRSKRGQNAIAPSTLDADGIIMRDYRGSPALLRRGIPIVFASYLHKDIRGSHRILPDDRVVGRMGAAHLLERGFRRFAFVGYESMYWSRQRRKSFSQAVSNAGCACAVFRHACDLRSQMWRKEQKALIDWLKTLDRPVGLMACNDDCARDVVDACATAGLAVPEDVAVVGVDNDEFVCNLSNPAISSVALGLEDAGYRAAVLLDQLMKARKCGKGKRSLAPHGPVAPASSEIVVLPVTVVTRHSSETLAIEDTSVAEAVRFIRANCRQPIQIADVLQEVAISRRTLLDRFKRTLGCTVHQYIKRTRVAQIEELLLGTSSSIGQIATTLGFPSSEHVALYFRSVKGVNPHAFRAQHVRG